MKDKQGIAYAKLSELEPGDLIRLDNGFTCHKSGEAYVRKDQKGHRYNEREQTSGK